MVPLACESEGSGAARSDFRGSRRVDDGFEDDSDGDDELGERLFAEGLLPILKGRCARGGKAGGIEVGCRMIKIEMVLQHR